MARNITSRPQTNPADATNPFGTVRNDSGPAETDGTTMEEAVVGDPLVFFQKLMSEVSITPNELADNETNGFQLFEALNKFVRARNYLRPGSRFTHTLPGNSTLSIGVGGSNGNLGLSVDGGNNVLRSIGGRYWRNTGVRLTAKRGGLVYNPDNNIWVSVERLTVGNHISRSTDDGNTWIESAITDEIYNIRYANGTFITTAQSGLLRTGTPNGVTWTSRSVGGVTDNLFDAGYNPTTNTWLVITSASEVYFSTNNGVSWTFRGNSPEQFRGLAFGNGVWIASSGDGNVYRSTNDGVSWTAIPIPQYEGLAFGLGNGIYANGIFFFSSGGPVASSNPSGHAISLDDGLTWQFIPTPEAAGVESYRVPVFFPDTQLFVMPSNESAGALVAVG